METEVIEKNVLIAERVPPGDRWELVDFESDVYDSLTDCLEAWFQVVEVKPVAFRLDFRSSKLYAIFKVEQEKPKPEIKRYNIYGEYL